MDTRDLFHTNPSSYPYFIMRVNTQVHMFYFLNKNMAVTFTSRVNFMNKNTD